MTASSPAVALVLGSAATLTEDVSAALKLFAPAAVIACPNAANRYTSQVDAMIGGAHGDPRIRWLADVEVPVQWEANGGWFPAQHNKGDIALWLALLRYAPKVVLAGLPESNEGGHLRGGNHTHAFTRRLYLMRKAAELGDRVRSMSGATAEIFGRPTPEWLAMPMPPVEWSPRYRDFTRTGPAVGGVLSGCSVESIGATLVAITAGEPMFPVYPREDVTVIADSREAAHGVVRSVAPLRLEVMRKHDRDGLPHLADVLSALAASGPPTLYRRLDGSLSLRWGTEPEPRPEPEVREHRHKPNPTRSRVITGQSPEISPERAARLRERMDRERRENAERARARLRKGPEGMPRG